MAQYESFNTTKRKIRKTWERNEQNTSDIQNKLQKFNVHFNSINFNKAIAEIKLVEDTLLDTSPDLITTVILEDFPEWIINHINVVSIINSTDGFPLTNFVNSFFEAFSNGTLSVGDASLITRTHYWIAKREDNNYELKIFNDPNLRIATSVSQFGFSTTAIPMFLNLSLKIINPRIYENNREKKQ